MKRVVIFFFLSLLCFARAAKSDGLNLFSDPTAHAWKLFAQLNQPVPNDPQGRVVWETWMLGRTVFANPNEKPVWNPLTPAVRTEETLEAMPLQLLVRKRLLETGKKGPGQVPAIDPNAGEGNETRMNEPAFRFIADNDLYYAEGIEAFAKAGRKFDFPREAIEVKAQWRRIRPPADAAKYHTAKVKRENGQEETWGLTSMHLTTKEVPNWFWATFEHRDNPSRESVNKDVQPQKQPESFRGTKWENYVLRGAQIEFTDSMGRPTILSSSQIEQSFQTSSCITCHALATVNWQRPASDGINSLAFFDENQNAPLGVPNPALFEINNGKPAFQQMDFVWSFFRAKRRNP
jgi:hypothetical protein